MALETRRIGFERIAFAVVGLALVVILVCIITLAPQPVDKGQSGLVSELLNFLHSKGVPQWFGYRKLEFSANIVMFVPLGFFAGLLLPIRRAWIAGLAGTTFSVLIEVWQLLLLPARFASVLDVLANTVGGWIGIGIAVLLRLIVTSRDRRVTEQAFAQQELMQLAVRAPGDAPNPTEVAAAETPHSSEVTPAANAPSWELAEVDDPSKQAED